MKVYFRDQSTYENYKRINLLKRLLIGFLIWFGRLIQLFLYNRNNEDSGFFMIKTRVKNFLRIFDYRIENSSAVGHPRVILKSNGSYDRAPFYGYIDLPENTSINDGRYDAFISMMGTGEGEIEHLHYTAFLNEHVRPMSKIGKGLAL